MQTEYYTIIHKVQELVESHSFTPVIKQALSYFIAIHLSLYYSESSTVKSAKKWIATVHQTTTSSSSDSFPFELAAEVRPLLLSHSTIPLVSCASIAPRPTQILISSTLLKAKLEYSRGNYGKVIAVCEPLREIVSSGRVNSFALSLMSSAYFALGKKHLARWSLETLISYLLSSNSSSNSSSNTTTSISSSSSSVLLDQYIVLGNLGIVYESIGWYHSAIQVFQQLQVCFFNNPVLIARFAESYWKLYKQEGQWNVREGKYVLLVDK